MMENHRILNVDRPLPASRSIAGRMSCPRSHLCNSYHCLILPQIKGFGTLMETQLQQTSFSLQNNYGWGPLGPDASEVLVRNKFEMFGPVNQFAFFAIKGFALVEYQNIMDAVRAREIMQGNSLWGAGLRVKFMDKGLGTKGSINSEGVGSSCYIYVGSVQSCWMKDDVVHELRKALQKGPRMVTDWR